jgi:hypothetical protein
MRPTIAEKENCHCGGEHDKKTCCKQRPTQEIIVYPGNYDLVQKLLFTTPVMAAENMTKNVL